MGVVVRVPFLTLAHSRRAAVAGAALCALLGGTARAATQFHDGDLVQVIVDDHGAPTVNVKPSTGALPADPYVGQYCCGTTHPGAWGSTLWLDDGATRAGDVTLHVAGDAQSGSTTALTVVDVGLEVSEASIDLGTLAAGQVGLRQVTVGNGGGSSLTLGAVEATAPFTIRDDTCANASLGTGATCTLTVAFSTGTWGTYAGSLDVAVSAPASVTRSIPLVAVVANVVTVTATAGANGALDRATPSPVTLLAGGTASFRFAADPGFHVRSVTGCGGAPFLNSAGGVTSYTYTTGPVAAPCAVAAVFAANSYTVTFLTDGTEGAVLHGSTLQSVIHGGATTAVTAVPSATTHFTGWTGSRGFASAANPLTLSDVTADTAVTATFAWGLEPGLVVTSSSNPSLVGGEVAFRASLGAAEATGTVQFVVDGAPLGGPVAVSGRVATSPATASLAAGIHEVSARYSGDGAYVPVTSTLPGGQSVVRWPSAVALAADAAGVVAGQEVVLRTRVDGGGGAVPSGSVAFLVDGTAAGASRLDDEGNAALPLRLGAGSHALTASYEGDGTCSPSSSAAVSLAVGKAATATLLLTGRNPGVDGEPMSVSAAVEALAPGAGTPTGSVVFLDGDTVVSTAALESGVAWATLTGLGVGTHALAARYGGDVNFIASTSALAAQVVVERCVIGGLVTGEGMASPDDTCLVCLPARSATAWSLAAAGAPCTDDGSPLTADVCDGAGTCAHPLKTECVIDGAAVAFGALNPENACQRCDPVADDRGWSFLLAGADCAGDGLDCTDDRCNGVGLCEHTLADGCLIGGACVAAGTSDPGNDCWACNPERGARSYSPRARGSDCTDEGVENTVDSCDGLGACQHTQRSDCAIGGATYPAGAAEPGNGCHACDPTLSASAWSHRAAGFPCATDDQACTADICDGAGQCIHALFAGCLVDGACVAAGDGEPGNGCRVCNPAADDSGYSPRPAGVGCADDGDSATVDVCDGRGGCAHPPRGQCVIDGEGYRSGAANPANPCQACQPERDLWGWTDRVAGFPCSSDGLDCTTDACDGAGACGHRLASGCLVDGACVDAAAAQPDNGCRSCQPALSASDYTHKAEGMPCADDGNPRTADRCDGAGACTHFLGGRCNIGGVEYQGGAGDPGNPCRWCDPQLSTSSWSPRATGFPCTSDGLGCTADTCGEGGACEHVLFTGCLVDGRCVADGAADPQAECRACLPAQAAHGYSNAARGVGCADDGDVDTVDHCNGQARCVHVPAGECEIGGQRLRGGTANPANPCQTCEPSSSQVSWTDRAAGFPCASDGLACTADACDGAGACGHRLVWGCLVAGTCVLEGGRDPAQECAACAPGTATDAYSPRDKGAPCADDGDPATLDACDGAGACTHPLQPPCIIDGLAWGAGATHPANPCLWCNSARDDVGWSYRPAGSACVSDGVRCTADTCDGRGTCGHTVRNACAIDGACLPGGATSPADECLECNPVDSTTGWTRKPVTLACGRTCASDADCHKGSFCGASICRPRRVPGAACAADGECASGRCAGALCESEPAGASECACVATGAGRGAGLAALLLLGLAWQGRRRR